MVCRAVKNVSRSIRGNVNVGNVLRNTLEDALRVSILHVRYRIHEMTKNTCVCSKYVLVEVRD